MKNILPKPLDLFRELSQKFIIRGVKSSTQINKNWLLGCMAKTWLLQAFLNCNNTSISSKQRKQKKKMFDEKFILEFMVFLIIFYSLFVIGSSTSIDYAQRKHSHPKWYKILKVWLQTKTLRNLFGTWNRLVEWNNYYEGITIPIFG